MQAVVCGYYGFGNGGDEALLAALLQMLPAGIKPVVLSNDPEQTRSTYGVEAVNRWQGAAVVQILRKSDLLILGGGSLLQDVTSARSLIYYGGLLWMAQRLGVRTVAWSQGIGPLGRGWTRGLVRALLAGCAQVSVRDGKSAQLMQDWGIAHTLVVDPVWALAPQPVALPDPGPWAAVALRPYPDLTPQRLELLILALAQFQRATNLAVLLIPFQLPGDVALAATIQGRLQGPSQILQLRDPRQLRGVFEQVRWCLAMRFHGVLMAAAAGCPVWGLSYDPKVTQLLHALGAPGLGLQDLPEQPAELAQQWLRHYAQEPGLSPAQRQHWQSQTLINQHLLEDLL